MNLDVTDGIKITEDDIYTVWYAEEYISDNLLKNPTSSVRLASTTLPDGKYYLQQYNSYDNIFTHMYVKNRNSVVDLNSDNIDKSFKETCYSIILKELFLYYNIAAIILSILSTHPLYASRFINLRFQHLYLFFLRKICF